jgi:hypothetical protein
VSDGSRREVHPRRAWALPAAAALLTVAIVALIVMASSHLGGRSTTLGNVAPSSLAVTLTPSQVGSRAAALEQSGTPGPASSSAASTAVAFDSARAMAHIRTIAGFGPRPGGSAAERKAIDYAKARFENLGYQTTLEKVVLPGGKATANVVARKPGTGKGLIILGGHVDSKYPAPGANDNASGVGVTLELARCLKDSTLEPSVEFVAFGCEEMVDKNPDHHHYGSRTHARLVRAKWAGSVAMISVDMVGVGDVFGVRSMKRGPQGLVSALQSFAGKNKIRLAYLQDTGRYGWSDHEPFELAGIPAAWLEWRDDPNYHTVRDTVSRVSAKRIQATGEFVRAFLMSATTAGIDSWTRH